MATLHYGEHAHVELNAVDGLSAVTLGVPRGEPVADLSAAVAAAIDEPLGFPPLGQATTPGDRVVLAIAPELPWAAEVVAAVVGKLVEAGVHPDGISVLTTERLLGGVEDDPCRLIAPQYREQTDQHVHDSANLVDLAYLAATEAGHPIMVSRVLHEADLVIPIGCLLDASFVGYFGIHTGIYPAFADADALVRFRSLGSLGHGKDHKQGLIDEVHEVAWLLGISFSIQLLPADGFRVLEVIAGHTDVVRQQAQERYTAAWRQPSAVRPASLVVAGIVGKPVIQTWQSLGRALETAGRLVDEGGAVAVCCELAGVPGPGVQRMVGAASRRAALSRIRKERPIDALPAAQIAEALDRFTVYLLSNLEPELVEDLDMVPIASPSELIRLASRHKSCTLLANASLAVLEP